ncbi:MAG: Diaminopimelate decarboxylase [Cellvibrionales bacterium UBA7375]|nr:MAG: Diaminopimelate decarboxylase [Cellvibrionales bacterium UBA7375]
MHSSVSINDNQRIMENVPLRAIVQQYGSPCYAYSKKAISENFLDYQQAMGSRDHLICYAVKSNSNIAVLQTLAKLGAGFDIVSVGELERVLMAGGDPAKVVYSGVAKTAEEMRRALEVGIHCFNVESESELRLLNQTAAETNQLAPVSLRVNPDVDAKTHPYISTGLKENKFGIDISRAQEVYQQAAQMENISVVGVDCHIGSQLTDITPFIEAMQHLLVLVDRLAELGIKLKHIDIGGGLGVRYQNEVVPSLASYMQALEPLLKDRSETLVMEPGRSITANAGILLTQVQVIKKNGDKNFAIVDAAMNDMLRPALYDAWMDINAVEVITDSEEADYDVVGPVCETGDFLAKDRTLSITEGDYLYLSSAGAYGFTMSSNYNSRPRVAEVMIDGNQTHLIRARESIEDLIRGEQLIKEQ